MAGSLRTTPLARNDSYSTVGNVQLSISLPGVLNNDVDADGTGGLSVTAFDVVIDAGFGGTQVSNQGTVSDLQRPASGWFLGGDRNLNNDKDTWTVTVVP